MTAPAGIDRPLSITEIVDRSVTLAVRRWSLLTVLFLIYVVAKDIAVAISPPTIPTSVLAGYAVNAVVGPLVYPAAVLTTAPTLVPPLPVVLRSAAARYGASFIGLVLNFAIVVVALVAGIAVVSPAVIAFIPNGFARGLGFGIGGIVVMILLLPGPLLFGQILYPIIVLESRSPWKAMCIAFRRVRSAGFRRAWQLGLTLIAFDYLPTFVLNLASNQVIRLTHASVLAYVARPLAEGSTMVSSMVIATVIWAEMCVRYEGSDIEAALGRADQAPFENGSASSVASSSAGSA